MLTHWGMVERSNADDRRCINEVSVNVQICNMTYPWWAISCWLVHQHLLSIPQRAKTQQQS